jgi:iron complex outermembrane receptor protein
MNRTLFFIATLFFFNLLSAQDSKQGEPADSSQRVTKTVISDEVIIRATRASAQTATTYSDLDKEEIKKRNFGQDLPFVMNQLPSTVVNSDAGTGIGYTGIRVRGTDPTRTNVTINGIPYNDPESHGTFWVNLPDMASSVNSLQLQRGVGTSTNGAAAFGASVNIQTTTLNPEAYAEINESFGSFNTWKHTLQAGTGLINEKFAFDIRLSNINSDGFVDRATADLKSFFASGAYYGKKSLLRINVFSGKEVTYQSWWGLPESKLEDDRTDNFYTYENEVDDYQQDHYQLHYSLQLADGLNLNTALHYTRGRGFFEQYREEEAFAAIGLPSLVLGDTTISSTDLIRRRWLDNHFYGTTYSLNYQPQNGKLADRLELTLGGSWNQYDGDHFGEIIWARFAGNTEIRDRYYDNRALKTDFNTYGKALLKLGDKLSAFLDLQYRQIDYRYGDSTLNAPGIDNDRRPLLGDFTFNFFNPKAGLTYTLDNRQQLYASFGISNREPVRNDFIDAPEGQTPLHETLRNLEVGYRLETQKLRLAANYYLMDYVNQLVLTGELNDVGSAVRTNVEDSYRMGVELDASWRVAPRLMLSGNVALSRNKIANFTETIYQYDENFDFTGIRTVQYENTDISFSPNVISGATLTYQPIKGLEFSWLSKFVGRQYLDNTQNVERSLAPFFVNNFRAFYSFQPSWAKEIRLGLLLNNVLNELYEPNGYTFNYEFDGQLIVENFYYPQAGPNFMLNLSARF